MKLGLLARADNTGLGTQTWEFYRHMKPFKTMVVDISRLNGNRQYTERYPDGQFITGFPSASDINDFLQGLDVVFVAESPYNYYLYERAKQLGVKVAVQYNYEFFDWYSWPNFPTPDLLIAPSKWHYDKVEEFAQSRGIKHTYLHVPVNRDVLPFREIRKARTFLHIAGKVAAHDRNGTDIVRQAQHFLGSAIEIKILNQANIDFENYWQLYKEGDVLLLPRRYGGNCLPVNEALSIGMPVIMTDISPNNEWLPSNWLVPAHKTAEFKPRMIIDIYDCEVKDLVDKIHYFAAMSESEMRYENIVANNLAQSISWKALEPEYRKVLGELCSL